MEDSSLDDFLDTGGDSDEGEGQPADAEADDSPAEADDSPDDTDGDSTEAADCLTEKDDDCLDVEPAVPTSRWERDGESCEGCGTTVNRLWTDDGRTVCEECKDWS